MKEVLPGMLRILLVENSPTHTRSIQVALAVCENLPSEVHMVDSLHSAFLAVEEAAPDVIVLNCSLCESIGLGTVYEMHALASRIPIVVLVPIDKGDLVKQIVRTGAQTCVLESDMDRGKLIRAIRRAVDTVECERFESLPARKREEVPLLFDKITEGFVTTNLQGDCAFCNSAAVQILGYRSPEDLLGKNFYALVRGMRSKSYGLRSSEPEYQIENVVRTCLPVYTDSEIFWRADGKLFLAEYLTSPLRRSNRIVGTVTVLRDISHSRLVAEEILESRAQFIRHAHRLIKIAMGRTIEESDGLREDDPFRMAHEETPWLLRYLPAYTGMLRGQ